MNRPGQLGIVRTGQRELRRLIEKEVRAEVAAAYAPLLPEAGPMRRLLLAWRMRREIRRAVEARAPRRALYAHGRRGT